MIKKSEIIRLFKRINLKLVLRGYSTKDKLNVIYSFFFLGPLRKIGVTKKEILITMKSKDGIFVCGDKSIHATSTNYEKPLRKFFDLKEGVFIDIGANFGRYTIMMARRLKNKGLVISMEPEPHTVKLLKQNVKLNKLKNVFVVGKACSSKNRKETLYLEETTYSGGLHSLKKYPYHVRKRTIQVETLDSIVSRLKVKIVGLIKIDVEGLEVNVLQGAQETLKKYHPKIICESLNKESEEGIIKILKKFKYNVERIDAENVFAY